MMVSQRREQELRLADCLSGLADCPASCRDREVNGIAMDSRQLQSGDIFVAMQGLTEHGLVYLSAALAKRPCAVLVDTGDLEELLQTVPETVLAKARKAGVALIEVKDIEEKLGVLANRVFDSPSEACYMTGITGTNGKTSCSHYLAQALNALQIRTALIGTLGNGFPGNLNMTQHTTPDVFSVHRFARRFVNEGAKEIAMEVSSHGLDQGRVDGVAFDAAIFTNLTQDHLDYHATMHEYGEAKQRLFEYPGLSLAIVNADDEFSDSILSVLGEGVELVAYGLSCCSHFDKYLWAERVRLNRRGMMLEIRSHRGDFTLSTGLMGMFNASNILAVSALMLQRGISIEDIQNAIAGLQAVPGRMQLVSSNAGTLAVVDYAHTPDALEKAIQASRAHLSNIEGGKIILVFGCGGDRDPGKRALMGAVADRLADKVILTDDNPRTESAEAIVQNIVDGIKHTEYEVIHNRRAAITYAIEAAGDNDIVLIAGKGHENYQIIGKEKIAFPCDAELAAAAFSFKGLGE